MTDPLLDRATQTWLRWCRRTGQRPLQPCRYASLVDGDRIDLANANGPLATYRLSEAGRLGQGRLVASLVLHYTDDGQDWYRQYQAQFQQQLEAHYARLREAWAQQAATWDAIHEALEARGGVRQAAARSNPDWSVRGF